MRESDRVLIALYRGQKPHTKRNDVISLLCRADLVTVAERHPGGTAKKLRLTDGGKIIAKKLVREFEQ